MTGERARGTNRDRVRRVALPSIAIELPRASVRRRALTRAVQACAVVGVFAAIRVFALYWTGEPSLFLRAKSSIWIALASDLAHGDLYRPVLGAAGYGGTRYMPLLFAIQALLMRLGLDPIASGVALMQASVAAAAVTLFVALRAFDVERSLALPLAATLYGSVIFQQSCTDLNPDYLAAAFALGGALAVLDPRRPSPRVYAGSILFVAAALTKITAAAFAIPVCVSLAAGGRRAEARTFAAAVAGGLAAALAIVDALSGGNFHRSFFAMAVAGIAPADIWRSIPKFLWELAIKPADVGAPFVLAAASTCATRGQRWPHGYLWTALAISIVIFIAPGTASNHLVDLQIASTLVIGIGLAREGILESIGAVGYAALGLVLVAISIPVPGVPSVVADIESAQPRPRDVARAIHTEFLASGEPYLSIDPIVPILNGDRPWLLDYASLEKLYVSGAPAGRDFATRIERRFFSAVIVPIGYDSPFSALLSANYAVAAIRPPFVVMRPRQ